MRSASHLSLAFLLCNAPSMGMEMNSWRPWGRSPPESCHVFCLLRLSHVCNFVLLRVPSRHWEPHLVSGLSEQLEQETLCSECWINGVGLLQEWVKSFQTLVHVRLPALLMKRILPLLMLGSYNSVGLLIKWGGARSRDIMFPISACKWFCGGQNILLVQPVVCCSRDESHHLCGLLWPLNYKLMKLVAKK